MTKTQVLAMLRGSKDPRGIAHWKTRGAGASGLKSYGIGLTRLRKMAKEIGRDRALALALWESEYYDAKILALLIDDPKQLSIEQVERQVEGLAGGHLAHVFSTCGSTLAKSPLVREVADRWIPHKDPVRRRCGYGLLYELAKSKKKSAPDDAYFLAWIEHIGKKHPEEGVDVLCAMAGALMGMGMRNVALHPHALKVARAIGPIDFDERGKCDPLDVVKHLTGDHAKKKLGLG